MSKSQTQPVLFIGWVFFMMELRICSICNQEKYLSEFISTNNRIYFQCRECISNRYKRDYQKWLANNCGGDKILGKPNQYQNKYQKDCVFKLMESLGYLYNESNGIWWKPGIKDEDGNFLKVIKRNKRIGRPGYTNIKDEKRKNIVKLYQQGYSYKRIEEILNISNTTISKIVNAYKNEKK